MPEYCIDSSAFLDRGRVLFNDKEHYPDTLFQCAFESRRCIERLSFEYLYMVRNKTMSNKDRELYSCTGITNKINKIMEDFENRMLFMNILLESHEFDADRQVPIPDFDKLKELYSNLSNYLHVPRNLPNPNGDTTISHSPLIG